MTEAGITELSATELRAGIRNVLELCHMQETFN